MPGPALTVSVEGDTTGLDTALETSATGLSGFARKLGGAIASMGGIVGIIDKAIRFLEFIVQLGGPEAEGAMSKLTDNLQTGLAPVLDKLVPLIVKFIEGLNQILLVVLPPLVSILGLLVSALSILFDWVGSVIEIVGELIDWGVKLWNAISTLIHLALDPLSAAFDGVARAIGGIRPLIDAVTGAINGFLELIAGALDRVQGFLDTIAGIPGALQGALPAQTRFPWEQGGFFNPRGPIEGGHGGGFGGRSITVNTGADPGAVIRAVRRYSQQNGGGQAFRRNVGWAR